MTKYEACLWKFALKASQLKGYYFRRQRPVLNFIADFMCKKLLLIIELPGISHQSEEGMSRDENRIRALRATGFAVIRFTDSEVLLEMQNVIMANKNTNDKIEKY